MTLFKCRIVYTDKWNGRIILIIHAERVDLGDVFFFFLFRRYLVEILTKASYTITEYYPPAKCRESRFILLFDNQRFLLDPL